MRARSLLAACLAVAGLALSTPARANELAEVEKGVAYYENNRFSECESKLRELLQPGSPTELKTRDNRTRARMYHGACLVFLKREGEARDQFDRLLEEDSLYAPSQGLFPPRVLELFTEVRTRHEDRIKEELRKKMEAEAKALREKQELERREAERRALIERMAQEQLSVDRSSRLVALLPFGAGQFQNRQQALGWMFFGTELAFASASVVTYILHEDVKRRYEPGRSDPDEANRLGRLYAGINYVTFGAFAAVAVVGVVQGQFAFVPSFTEKQKRPLPPPITVAPQTSREGASLIVQGAF